MDNVKGYWIDSEGMPGPYHRAQSLALAEDLAPVHRLLSRVENSSGFGK